MLRRFLLAYIRRTPAPPLTDSERLAQVWCEVWTAQKNINDDLRGESIASAAWRRVSVSRAA
jgi:hypothetical protein